MITLDSETSDSNEGDRNCFQSGPCDGSDIENYQPLLTDQSPSTPVQVKQTKDLKKSSNTGGSSIKITKIQDKVKTDRKLSSPPSILGPKSKIATSSKSVSVPAPSRPIANYTANSSGQPIDVRRNLQCMQCKKLLKDLHHPVRYIRGNIILVRLFYTMNFIS